MSSIQFSSLPQVFPHGIALDWWLKFCIIVGPILWKRHMSSNAKTRIAKLLRNVVGLLTCHEVIGNYAVKTSQNVRGMWSVFMHKAVLNDCSLPTLFLAYQTTTCHLQDCRLFHFFCASDLFWCVFCRCSSKSVSVTLSESFILPVWQNESSLRGHEASAHRHKGMPCETLI